MPAQFAFLLREAPAARPWQIRVISGSRSWPAVPADGSIAAQDVLGKACINKCSSRCGAVATPQLQLAHLIVEKRATFRCTPMLDRPPSRIARGLWAAGDYVEGRYPATLEGPCAQDVPQPAYDRRAVLRAPAFTMQHVRIVKPEQQWTRSFHLSKTALESVDIGLMPHSRT